MPAPAPPGRRTEAAGARDRRILLAARACFATSGFEGTTMGAVARAAGVAVGTLYLRAATKEALLARVLEDIEQELAAVMDAAAQAAEAWPDRFPAVFEALLRAVAAMPELPDLMRLAQHAPPRPGAQPGPIRAWIAGFIRAGQAAGALRPVDPALAAAMAFGMVEGAMAAHAGGAGPSGATSGGATSGGAGPSGPAVAGALADAAGRWLLATPPSGRGPVRSRPLPGDGC